MVQLLKEEGFKMNSVSSLDGVVKFARDQIIFKKGDEATYFYIIKKGKVGIFVSTQKAATLVSVLGAQDFIGELTLFSNESRSATVIALQETEAYLIKKSHISKVLKECPEWVTDIMLTLSDRLRSTTKVLSDHGIVEDIPIEQDEVARLSKLVLNQFK